MTEHLPPPDPTTAAPGTVPVRVFAGFCALVLLVATFWFMSAGESLKSDDPVRIVLGGLILFLIPGLFWGEILGFHAEHPLEVIALSFALTLVIEIAILPIVLLLHLSISWWVGILLLICLAGIAIVFFKRRQSQDPVFFSPLIGCFLLPSPLNVSTVVTLFVLAFASCAAYRWGESVTDIEGEKVLHLIFVRQYYSMPLNIADLGLKQGIPPPNLINLWEFLIAGWARLIHMDPLPLFYRARLVCPALGLPGMYLLIRSFFPHSTLVRRELIFFSALALSLGGFIFLSPSSLDWVKEDPYRFVMHFMGTVHHSDTAMDILLVLCFALVHLTVRDLNSKLFFLLVGVLTATFMWHPREFFQVWVYGTVLGMAYAVLSVPRTKIARNWAAAMSAFLLVLVLMYPIIRLTVPSRSTGYDELAIKKTALAYAFSVESLAVRNMFNFPDYANLTRSGSGDPETILERDTFMTGVWKEWHHPLWLILSAIAVAVLAFWGNAEMKRLSLFMFLVWFLMLAWDFSLLLVLSMTYSEFYICTPRLLYLFSYLMVGSMLVLVAERLASHMSARRAALAFCVFTLFSGLLVRQWWMQENFRSACVVLNAAAWIAFVWLLFTRRKGDAPCDAGRVLFLPTAAGILLFSCPVLGWEMQANMMKLVSGSRPSVDWYGKDNPFGFSPSALRFIDTLPLKRTFLVNPLGTHVISVYSAQYLVAVPQIIGTVLADMKFYQEVRENRHPLYRGPRRGEEKGGDTPGMGIDDEKARDWLNRHGVEYIYIGKGDYDLLAPYLRQHPRAYEIPYDSPVDREMVARRSSFSASPPCPTW